MNWRTSSLLTFILAASVANAARPVFPPSPRLVLEALLRDPTPDQWRALSRFNATLSRSVFEARLDSIFDPEHALRPYLQVSDEEAAVYASPRREGRPIAVIRFVPRLALKSPNPVRFRPAADFCAQAAPGTGPPLAGLRVAIEPADIGGRWARMEDRSVEFHGYGRINEGDLNLIVGERLRDELVRLGAVVFLVRNRAEPVLALEPQQAESAAEAILRARPSLLPGASPSGTAIRGLEYPARLQRAAGLLLTKTAETRARAEWVRRRFIPDLTIVLQHNATPESGEGRLAKVNRNIFFVHGAYTPAEVREPEQRFRLLTKLLENVTPVEAEVAGAIAARFHAVTGFPPVLYGNSETTRLILPGNSYVVLRNLAFSREHDGPVVVTEPYFMNQPETLARLLAGDYTGERLVAGQERSSIYREYAGCVADGILSVYGPRPQRDPRLVSLAQP